ncbi:peptidoglycan-binding protein [Catenulispora sp. GP43]|uniref:peptidoglycan-binding domain-containing protein n=1 Tax=Catenulispora sp. GP43 TaxID=3156263 RepID=UPI003515E82E
MSSQTPAGVSDPTQAYAAVGAGGQGGPSAPPERGLTWQLPTQPQDEATQAIPAQNVPPEPDPYAHLYRPEGGPERPRPNATQVMAPVPEDFGRSDYPQQAFDQPAYDQPIDYQAAGGGAYGEPYEGGYTEDYPGGPGNGPRSNRGAKIGIGVAAAAVVVIVVSLITLGGGSSTPSAGPAINPGSVTTPTTPPSSSAQSAVANAPTSSTPSSSASTPAERVPGQWQLGDSGPEVKWIQTRLHQLGLYNGPINSTFDAATQAAVAAFQARSHASDPSGVVGRSTKTALIAAGSKPTLTPQLPNLPGGPFGGDKHHKPASAADVKRLQEALAAALNTDVKATGQYDMDTFSAVVQYQSAMHLAADGVVNGPMWAALQQGRITG